MGDLYARSLILTEVDESGRHDNAKRLEHPWYCEVWASSTHEFGQLPFARGLISPAVASGTSMISSTSMGVVFYQDGRPLLCRLHVSYHILTPRTLACHAPWTCHGASTTAILSGPPHLGRATVPAPPLFCPDPLLPPLEQCTGPHHGHGKLLCAAG